jgi:hypothetical protein
MRQFITSILLLIGLTASGQYVDNSGNIFTYFDYGTAIFNSASDKATYTYNDTTYIDTLYDIQNRYHLTNEDSVYLTGEDTLNFDGVDDRLNSNYTLNFTENDLSISCWVKFKDADGRHNVFGTSSSTVFFLTRYEESLSYAFLVQFYDGSTALTVSSPNTAYYNQNDTWYHVVLTYNGRKKRITVTFDRTNTFTETDTDFTSITGRPLYLGAQKNIHYHNGQIADTRIFDHVLSAQEIKALYEGGINDNAVNIIE